MSELRVTGLAPGVAEPFDSIASALVDTGYAIIPDFLEDEVVAALLEELHVFREEGDLSRAAVGTGVDKDVRSEIRSDRVLWLEKAELSPPQLAWWQRMEELRISLNRQLFLGLFELEAHMACFPEGSFYKPHLDRHRGTSERQITVINYLNSGWSEEDGGLLRLYTDRSLGVAGPFLDILPEAGKLVVFLSGDFWHEVLPARRERFSVTGWFRCRDASTPLVL